MFRVLKCLLGTQRVQAKPEVVHGAHRFLSDVIRGAEQSTINSVFIELFNQFTKVQVKDYIYRRITKSFFLELFLCLVQQELISGALTGPSR